MPIHIEAARTHIVENAVLGDKLLKLFDRITLGSKITGRIHTQERIGDEESIPHDTSVALLTGDVNLPGVSNRYHVALASGDLHAMLKVDRRPEDGYVDPYAEGRFTRADLEQLKGVGERVIEIRTGPFDSDGNQLTEVQPDGTVKGLAHLIEVTRRNGVTTEDQIVHDALLDGIRGAARMDLGQELADKMLFFKD